MTTDLVVTYQPRGAARELFKTRQGEILLDGPWDNGRKRPRRVRQHPRGVETTWMRGDLMGQRICDVPDCGKKHHARGYCNTHYARLQATGTEDLTPRVRKTCTFPDCGRPAVSGGLCRSHNNQVRRGVPLTALRGFHRSTIRDGQGRKRCHACKMWRDVADFYPKPKTADGLSSTCKRCDRSIRIRRNYGITLDQYEAMLAAQGGGCAICGTVPEDGRALHIDHDHACCPTRKKSCGECVRGLLCEDCNRVLGMFADRIPRFESAIDYLKNGGARRG